MAERTMFNLDGKVALVTGAGSGIGRAIALALAEYGSAVVCADIVEERAQETVELLKKYQVKSTAVKTDVSREDQVKALFEKTGKEFGRLDVLFNNAGVSTRGRLLHEMPLEDWNRVLNVDLTGVFLCMKEGIGLMLKQEKGSIINISSVLGMGGVSPEILATSNYVAAKHGVIGLTRSGAAQYAPHNIRVNAIVPGFYQGTRLSETEQMSKERSQKVAEMIMQLTPMKRTGGIDELKGLAVFLASDAASFITGAIMTVDGGWTAW